MMDYRYRSVKVYVLTAMLILFLAVSFYILCSNISQLYTSWNKFTENEMEKSECINNAIVNFGYGGFIHNFKNSVLRRDFNCLEKSEVQINQSLYSLDRYLELVSEYKEEVFNIKSVLSEYKSHLVELQYLIESNANIELIDEKIKVDDAKSVQALNILNSSKKKAIENSR